MADALMGVTETQAAAMDVIAPLVQTFLEQESKMLPLVTDYSRFAVKGAKQVEIPRSGGFTVASKSENTAADATVVTYSTDAIPLTSHKYVQFLLEDIADLQANIEVVSDAVMKATKNLARDLDQAIINQLEAASASGPDHRVAYANNPTDTIQETDILNARKLLIQQFIDPTECWIGVSPAQEEAMLKLSNFIDASKYGEGAALASGEIGKVFGMKVIVHNDIEDLKTLVWHPSACGFAVQQGIRFQSDLDLANLGTRYSLDMLYGVLVLDSGKRNVMVGTAS